MNPKWKKLFVVCIILFSLMMYNFFNSISITRKYENVLIKTQRRFYENPKKDILLNPTDYRYNEIRLFDKYLEYNDPELFLICVFDGKGCSPCMITEIKLINEVFLQYPNRVKAFIIGDNSKMMAQYNPLFDFTVLSSYDSLFSDYTLYPKNNNIIVNNRGEIIDIHRPEVGVNLKSKLFYSRFKYLIKLNSK